MAKKAAAKPITKKPDAGLRPLEWAALEIIARKCKDHAADRPVGSAIPVDVTVRIHGAIDQAEPSSANVKRRATASELLAAALLAMPAADRRDFARKLVAKLGAEADAEVDRQVEEIVESTTTDCLQSKKGALTGALALELVGRGAGRKAG